MSIREFAQLYWERSEGNNVKIPKAMDAAFSVPATDEERRIKEAIDRFNSEQATKLEQELFKQRARLADIDLTTNIDWRPEQGGALATSGTIRAILGY